MLKLILCDDEPLHNKMMQSYVKSIIDKNQLDAELVFVSNIIEPVIGFINNVDDRYAYFIDIVMQGEKNGIEAAMEIRVKDPKCYIVFITAHPDYALDGYKSRAFDYLLKPLSLAHLEKCILNIVEDYRLDDNAEKLEIKAGSKTHFIPLKDILYFTVMRNVLSVATETSTISCYYTLSEILKMLPANYFVQCHKSYAINIDRIDNIGWPKSQVTMTNGHVCPISRKYSKLLKEALPKERGVSL